MVWLLAGRRCWRGWGRWWRGWPGWRWRRAGRWRWMRWGGWPPLGYSWGLQRLAEMYCRSVSYEQGHEFVLAATGVSVGKRQLEQIVVAAAADAERFYRNRDQAAAVPAAREPGQGPGQGLPPLALSADGKGVAMLPEARRRRTKAPAQRVRPFEKRAGTGEQEGC